MGFLNHSTNNIIIDAVLTERGRELLSRNDGSFEITQFSFGDDEVDYTNITKYGPIIGKEKIEKNTPIFEASTNENIALKNKLISLSSTNVRILFMPIINLFSDSNGGTSLDTVNLRFGTGTQSTQDKESQVYIRTNIESGSDNVFLDNKIIDDNFMVKLNSDLLEIKRSSTATVESPLDIDQNKIATYRLGFGAHPTRSSNDQGLRQGEFVVMLKNNFSTSLFSKYSRSGSSATIIDTEVQIVGGNSNARKILKVKIQAGS